MTKQFRHVEVVHEQPDPWTYLPSTSIYTTTYRGMAFPGGSPLHAELSHVSNILSERSTRSTRTDCDAVDAIPVDNAMSAMYIQHVECVCNPVEEPPSKLRDRTIRVASWQSRTGA